MSDTAIASGLGHARPTDAGTDFAPTLLPILRETGARRVLDLGVRKGQLAGQMQAAGLEVVGLSLDAAAMDAAQRACPKVTFYRMGVQDDPAELLALEQPFDAVVATDMIEHLYLPGQLPRFARAVLRPGGRALVSTPYHGYLKNLSLALAGRWDHHHTALWDGGRIKFFSRATLTELLQANGLEVDRFVGVGRAPYLWKSMVLVGTRRDR
jgi:2-polyprenyl-3-methyl-5-hydroxy-6-metoxy-1,4-benzoquinol methylase